MHLPKEKQVFIPYLNGVDMFRNANLTSNTGYTCKMLKTMRGSLASLSGYGVCRFWRIGCMGGYRLIL